MLDPELHKKIRHLQLWAQKSVAGAMQGIYTSFFTGSGLECEDFRQYTPGDEIKHIDWKLTARSQNPHVRLYHEERDTTLLLLVDISSSMYFGSVAHKEKIDMSTQLTALLCALAAAQHDRSALGLFSHEVSAYCPPSRGTAHFYDMLQTVMSAQRLKQTTSMKAALSWCLKVLRRRSLVVVVSDFLDPGDYTRELKMLALKHDLTCVRIYDPLEKHPPQGVSPWLLCDGETGKTWLAGAHGPQTGTQELASQRWLQRMKQYRVHALEVDCTVCPVAVLLRILHRRSGARRPRFFSL